MASGLADTPYCGRLAGAEHRFALRVYYEDTDAGGVVYHANYLRFLERARSDLLHLLGIDQAAALARGEGGYVVARIELDYRAPARLGDGLLVTSRAADIRGSSLRIHQCVTCGDALLVDGRLTIAFVSEGRARRQPAAWLTAFRTWAGE